MKYARSIGYIMLVSLLLTLVQCRKEVPPPAPQDEKTVAPVPAPSVSIAEMEALEQKVANLESQVQELDEARARIVGLEEQLGYVKSGLNNLEKRPIPAPVAKEEEPEDVKDPPATEAKPESETETDPVDVAEPVPTSPTDDEGGKEDLGDVVETPDDSAIPAGDVSLVNMKFATKVDRDTRLPVADNTVFSRSENRLYCWLVLSNMAEEETQIRLFWKREGQVVSEINLRVGKHTSHWRTWAYIKPHSVGAWEVELQDMTGRVIGTGSFTVE